MELPEDALQALSNLSNARHNAEDNHPLRAEAPRAAKFFLANETRDGTECFSSARFMRLASLFLVPTPWRDIPHDRPGVVVHRDRISGFLGTRNEVSHVPRENIGVGGVLEAPTC
jgi:hypothetical protein